MGRFGLDAIANGWLVKTPDGIVYRKELDSAVDLMKRKIEKAQEAATKADETENDGAEA